MQRKNIFMKQFYIVFATMVTILAVGCTKDLLEKPPRGERTLSNFFLTEDDAVQATNATYEQMVNFDRADGFWSSVHYIWYLGMTDIASDDSNKGTEPTDGTDVGRIDDLNYDPAEGVFNGLWEWYYQIIYRANSAIENIPNIEMDEGMKTRLIGENKFIRAYSYFFLVRSYGGVPLITAPSAIGEFEQPRAEVSAVYDQIESDLNDAIAALPLKSEYELNDLGRATKGAAQGLLAKVHMFQNEYQEAENLALEVINSGEYSLTPDYSQIFVPEGENNVESIFEIQALAASDFSGGTTFSNPQGVRGGLNLGWGFNSSERDLLDSYEPGDDRMQSTVLFVHETTPYGPAAAVTDNPFMIDERYNQKAFTPLENTGGNLNSGTNIRRLRYSDILLTAAEAAFQNGKVADAQMYVNMVRARARNGQSATLGVIPEALDGVVANAVGMPGITGSPFVRYVGPSGPSFDAGIQPIEWELVESNSILLVNNLDVIKSIDGVSVSTMSEYRTQMESLSPGSSVPVVVDRITETYSGGSKSTNVQTLNLSITTEELLPDITSSGQQLLEAIWHERRVELAMEQHRLFDIRRQGRAGELLRAQGKDFIDGQHELFPIPRNELNLNPLLEQNPGYN